jgi:hypothetical protein
MVVLVIDLAFSFFASQRFTRQSVTYLFYDEKK